MSPVKIAFIFTIACTIVVFVFTQTGNGQTGINRAEKGAVKTLQPKQVYELIKKNSENPDFVILDIRTFQEFINGHIPGALNIDYYSHTFVANIEHLDKKKTYFIYCRTGRRTSEAVRIMLRQGFVNICTSYGDIVAWRAADLPLIKDTQGKKY
jgi:rhodanese-related sulfurtransferase